VNDFIIDLDNVWKWCKFSRKDVGKRILENNFTEGVDYTISLHDSVESNNSRGGDHRSELILTFKMFLLERKKFVNTMLDWKRSFMKPMQKKMKSW